VQQGVLQVDGALLLRGHGAPVVAPVQPGRGLQVGDGALQGQPVPPEHQLPLGGDQLEEGQLQGLVWWRKRRRRRRRRREVEEEETAIL